MQDHVALRDEVPQELMLRIGKLILDPVLSANTRKRVLERSHFVGLEVETGSDEPSHAS